jgi:hypothetical protein
MIQEKPGTPEQLFINAFYFLVLCIQSLLLCIATFNGYPVGSTFGSQVVYQWLIQFYTFPLVLIITLIFLVWRSRQRAKTKNVMGFLTAFKPLLLHTIVFLVCSIFIQITGANLGT